MKRLSVVVLVLMLVTGVMRGQDYTGTTGLLQVTCAEVDSAGTFRGGAYFLDKRFIPAKFGDNSYNTFGYTFGLTAFRWLELSYSATLLYMYKNRDKTGPKGYYNEDRHVNVKVTPLYEGKWWPAIAIGMDDIGRFKRFKDGNSSNNYYQNIFIAATKHFDIKGYELGAHLAYRYYSRDANKDRRGVAGGLTLRPAFYRPLRFIAEWDGVGVNVGADVLLWRHLFIQAALVHGRGFTGGLSYHYTIPQ